MRDFDVLLITHQGFDFHVYVNTTDALVISEAIHGGAGTASMNAAIDAWWKLSDQFKLFAEKYQEQIANIPESWSGESADSFRNRITQYNNWLLKFRGFVKDTVIYLEAIRNAHKEMLTKMPTPNSITLDRDMLKVAQKRNLFGSQTAWINKYEIDDIENCAKVKELISTYYVAVRELTKDLPSFLSPPYKCNEEKPIPDEGLRGVQVLKVSPDGGFSFSIGALGNTGAVGY